MDFHRKRIRWLNVTGGRDFPGRVTVRLSGYWKNAINSIRAVDDHFEFGASAQMPKPRTIQRIAEKMMKMLFTL